MNIVVIGSGAMGSIFGGNLSKNDNVYLVDTNPALVEEINKNGLKIEERGQENIYHPTALTNTKDLHDIDLVILFVKALYSEQALKQNQHLFGPNTYLLTLQNGGGHEDLLQQFVAKDKVIIGTTEDDGRVLGTAHVKRGGNGVVNFGLAFADNNTFIDKLAQTFEAAGFTPKPNNNIQEIIWKKLYRNATLSSVTGLLQCRIGYIYENPYAWELVKALAEDIAKVSNAMNIPVEVEAILEDAKETAIRSADGVTSICADIRAKRKTEVDTISGYVVRKAQALGIDVPAQEFLVNAIHALENRED